MREKRAGGYSKVWRVVLEKKGDRERELAAGEPKVSSLFTLVFLLYTPHLLPFCLLRIRWLI